MATKFQDRLEEAIEAHFTEPPPILPTPEALTRASASLPTLPSEGSIGSRDHLPQHSTDKTITHLLDDILPALSGQALSSRYYGFVVGSVHPAAAAADAIVTAMDQNVQVHLPNVTVATELEVVTLDMLGDLLGVNFTNAGQTTRFAGRTFTTGATSSNVLGLACGREAIIQKRLPAGSPAVGELGLLEACSRAGIKKIQVLTSAGHSSLSKASSIVGIGRGCVREITQGKGSTPWLLDIDAVEEELKAGNESGTATIIAISLGEVNTGYYAVQHLDDYKRLAALAREHKAWIHVDGAFGIFASVLPAEPQFEKVRNKVLGVANYVDSITVDGHKLLNVPYDCGMFYTRSGDILPQVFQNPNAAYLSSSAKAAVPSPLNQGIENSRRFRALPAYAVLHAEGAQGMGAMISRMVRLAREVVQFLRESEHYEWMPSEEADVDDTFIIVLFRAKVDSLNDVLVERINETRDMYVSGTSWDGRKAVRIAISTFKVDVERDAAVIKKILTDVARSHS